MAFQNVEMTEEEEAWEETLGLKDPYLSYKHDLEYRPNGSDMTVDRERKMYLLGIRSSGDLREVPDESTLYYFVFLSEDGLLLYFTSNQIIQYDAEDNEICYVWKIAEVDLFKNMMGLSKEQIFAFLSEALEVYGEDGTEPWGNSPQTPGLADFSDAIMNEYT